MAPTTEDVEFRASDLIGSAGVGANGEKLIATLDAHYPAELDAALLRRPNAALTEKLKGDERKLASVAKIAGVEEIGDVKVRGGERSDDDAFVTYAYIDSRGTVVKGAFPYGDLGKSSSDGHISQRDSVLESPAARDHLAAQEKARAAASTPAAEPAEAPGPVDPIASYEDMKAKDVTAYLEAHPERAAAIKAIESATRGEDARPTILNWEPPTEPTGNGDGNGDGQGDAGGDQT